MWQYWTTIVLGLCVLGVAFLNLSGAALVWSLGVLGGLTLIVGLSETLSGASEAKHA